jgi:hypothetical protein
MTRTPAPLSRQLRSFRPRRTASALLFLGAALTALASACVSPDAASCVPTDSCGDCIRAGSGCGYCGTTGSCVAGTSDGPATGSCDSWEFSACTAPAPTGTGSPGVDSGPPPSTCGEQGGCTGCTESNCVWCANGQNGGVCVAYGSGGTCAGGALTESYQCSSLNCLPAGSTCNVTTGNCCSLDCEESDPQDPEDEQGTCL